jgi:hypothetical protein
VFPSRPTSLPPPSIKVCVFFFMDQLQKKKWKEQEKISGRVSQEA